MAKAKCLLKNIIVPDWTSVFPEHWQAIYEAIQNSGWHGKKGVRRGFVSAICEGPMIGAYFAHEGLKRGIQYDNKKNPIAPSDAFLFEHLFFVIFLDYGQLLLQQKKIYGFEDLGLGMMRDRLFETLADVFREAGIKFSAPRIEVKDARKTLTQGMLYEFFMTYHPIFLKIGHLKGAKVPEHIRLFNPEEDWDLIARAAIDKTLETGLERAVLLGTDLNLGPIVKGLAAAGEIQEVQARDDRGRLIYREKKQKAELVIELPLMPEMTLAILRMIFDRTDRMGRQELAESKELINGSLLPPPDIEVGPEEQRRARIASLQHQIAIHKWSVNTLEERRALYGISVPLELANEIRVLQERLSSLEEELAGLKEQ